MAVEDPCFRPCFPIYTCGWCMTYHPLKPYPDLIVFDQPHLGKSVRSTSDIPAGTYIASYVGKRFTQARTGPYVMEVVSGKLWIDASIGGNISRFINHSCHPNCEVYIEPHTFRAMIFALRTIPAGEELTFCYSSKKIDIPFACLCPRCRKN